MTCGRLPVSRSKRKNKGTSMLGNRHTVTLLSLNPHCAIQHSPTFQPRLVPTATLLLNLAATFTLFSLNLVSLSGPPPPTLTLHVTPPSVSYALPCCLKHPLSSPKQS